MYSILKPCLIELCGLRCGTLKNCLLQEKLFHLHCPCYKASKEDVEKRQKEMMSRALPKKHPIAGVKEIVLVASGKGGVGKSTTAVNLAVALKNIEPSKEVGLLDADVYGPSVPLMMNLNETPLLTKENLMKPLTNYGVKCMSMGFLIEEKSAVVWRGLMVMGALEKLLRQVAWDSLDYLIVDTPPGTGDTLLSLMQNIPISGVVVVTTPQKTALQVARRGGSMFRKLDVPLVGVVLNMSAAICPKCKSPVPVFGNQGAEALAAELGCDLLENIPLTPVISENIDSGKPIVVAEPNSIEAACYRSLAKKVLFFLNNRSNVER